MPKDTATTQAGSGADTQLPPTADAATKPRRRQRQRQRPRQPSAAGTRAAWLVGPALVAGVAYLDPGNVASNMTAGARYG
jgi:manganese transport protein